MEKGFRPNYKQVKEYVERVSKCKLVTNEYINSKSKMNLKCECGNVFTTTFTKFRSRNKRKCNDCSGINRLTPKMVKVYSDINGLKLLDNLPNSFTDKRTYVDSESYKVFTSVHQLRVTLEVRRFHVSNPYTIENIKTFLKNNNAGCRLLSREYKSSHNHKLLFECKCGNQYKRRLSDVRFRKEFECYDCGIKRRSGKNHYDYNFSLTKDERIANRRLTSNKNMRTFRNSVYKRDDYTCVICKDKSSVGNKVCLNAHHLNGYHWYEEGRFDSSNGVTLCYNCHKGFHDEYGRSNNTKEQFDEYLENINKDLQLN